MPLLRAVAADLPLRLAKAVTVAKQPQRDSPEGSGSGRSLPLPLLVVSTLSAIFASLFSVYLIWKQLKNYRKPTLQRYVVRLLLMVPIYSIASVISLYSLQLADIIDLIRDLYEAFVIYCFFNLLIEYLGGERSLIVLLHGRRPQEHLFPANLFLNDMDASDPYTFLALKRGVLQYVQVKPVLAVATLILKAAGKYEEGKISPTNGYTWVSFTYNVSVFLSLYCLGMFWKCLNDDLKPFRVTSKFLCIKGIIFFSFWQGLGISILVAAGLVKKVGPVYDPEYISMAIQDFMICLEMPIFALGHAWAFSHTDYIDPFAHYAARLPVYYALRDCIGMYDVFSDSLTTVRGTGYVYQTFEPSEGVIHQPLARERRSKAGLRYTQGGKGKYWLPQRGTGDIRDATRGARHQGPLKKLRRYINDKRMQLEGHAPLTPGEADEIVHEDPDLAQEEGSSERSPLLRHPKHAARSAVRHAGEGLDFFAERRLDSDEEAEDLKFDDPDEEEEDAYQKSRTLHFGDYAYPNIDINREEARHSRWQQDDEIVHRRRRKSTLSKKDEAKDGNRKGRQSDEAVEGGTAVGSSKKQTQADGDAEGASKGKAKKKGEDVVANAKQASGKKDDKQPAPTCNDHKSTSPWLAWDREADGSPGPAKHASTANGSNTHQGDTAKSTEDQPDSQEPEDKSQDSDPYGAVDLVIEDYKAEERERLLERRRGDPALRAGKGTRIFRKQYTPTTSGASTPTAEKKFPNQNVVERAGTPNTPLNPPSSTAAAVTVKSPGEQSNSSKDKKVKVELEDATQNGQVGKKNGNGGAGEGNVLVSREIDVQENEDFLKGRVLSPEPGSVHEDDGQNPWS
ncbi:Transmembrane protein 184-like protein [Pseudozyma hubeiensis]|nr:Transmembrane protein 184-like protein [Pseudozyma hubeiensis]